MLADRLVTRSGTSRVSDLPTDPRAHPYWDPSGEIKDRFYIQRLVRDTSKPGNCARSEFLHADNRWRGSILNEKKEPTGLFTEAEAKHALDS